MKGDEPEIDVAQTLKRFNGRLGLPEKIQKTFIDSILNKDRGSSSREILSYQKFNTSKAAKVALKPR